MEREVAVREWAVQVALQARTDAGQLPVIEDIADVIIEDAQKLLEFVTEKQSRPNTP